MLAAALAAIFLLAFGLRSLGFPAVFPEDGSVVFAVGDAQYHLRRAQWTLANYPQVPRFDPYINFPAGAPVPWPPLFDFALASAARALGGSRVVLERVAAWSPVVLGSLAVLPVFALGRRVRGPALGLGAAAIYAALQIAVNYGRVGNPDHHAAVALIGGCLVALYAAVLDDLRPGGPVARAFAGLVAARCALLLSWQGSLLYLGPGELAVVLHATLRGRGDLLTAQAASCLATAAVVIPFVVGAPPGVGGTYSAVELSRLHVLAFLAAAGVAGGVALLERRRPAPGAGLRLGRAAGLVALAALAVAALPETREGGLRAFEWLSKSDRFAEMVFENQPLLADLSGPSRRFAEYLTGYYAYLVPLVPVAFLLEARRRREKAPLLFLAAWSGFSGLLALSQIRYANDFAVVGCVGFGLIVAAPARWLAGAAPRAAPWAPLATTLLGIGLLGPMLWSAHLPALQRSLSLLGGPRPDVASRSVERSAQRFALAVRDATPPTAGLYEEGVRPAYGILSLPMLGHVLHYHAERATPADPFGPYIGRENFERARGFYLDVRSEAEAVRTLQDLGARYVVTSSTGEGDAGTVADHLHRHDGSARRGRSHLGRFRLVTEGPPGGLAMGAVLGTERRADSVPYKLFERVEGARLEVAADPGEEVRAAVSVRTPTGRTLRYLARARADASGRARLRVPYATSGGGPIRALGPYRVQTSGEAGAPALSVEVDESDVREGRVLRVGGGS